MSVFDLFKKKNTGVGISSLTSKGGINPPPETPRPEPPMADAVKEELPKKTDSELFEEWYSSLTPEMRKRVDNKIEKLALRAGTLVCCKICGKPGSNKDTGPFRKTKDSYVHQNYLTGGM
jgi:hypothetical protein